MVNTENLGELFAAMAAARLEFGAVVKNKTANTGSYSYDYAELNEVIDATASALAKHGLVIIQEPEVVTEGGQTTVVVSGCIGHKSGGIYALRPLALPVAAKTAQAVGSAVSYARRYQLSAILNLAASDDDGQAAQDAQPAPKTTQKPTAKPIANPEGDVLFAKETPPHQRLFGQGIGTFGPEWDMARPWLLSGWSAKVQKGEPRDSASQFSNDEKDMLADYIRDNAKSLQDKWQKYKATLAQATETA